MSDQASKLRELADTADPGPAPSPAGIPMIAVTGSRAGVGATTVAVNLAAVLSDWGERVVLVDAAAERANLTDVAGVGGAIKHRVSDVASGSCGAAAALATGPVGTMVLAASSRVSSRSEGEYSPRRIVDRTKSPPCDRSRYVQQRLLSELQSLGELASVIVIDTGTGLSPWTQRFWTCARLAILVTTPDDEAVLGTYAILKRCAADAIEADVRVLANQCASSAAASAVYERLSVASKRFLSRTIATLPSLPMHRPDPCLRACNLPRVWESPNTPFGRAALWLGQAVSELVPTDDAAVTLPCAARSKGKTSLFQFPQNGSSRRAPAADNSRHHTGVPVDVKLAELRQA